MEPIIIINSNLGYWGADALSEIVELSFDVTVAKGAFGTKAAEILTLKTESFTPVSGSKIYFLPGVSVPRVKFKDYSVVNGLKTVRDYKEANLYFASEDSLNKMCNVSYEYIIQTDIIRKFVNEFREDSRFIDEYYIEKLDTVLEFYNNPYVAVDHGFMLTLKKHYKKKGKETYRRLYVVKPEYDEMLSYLFDNKVEFIDEELIIENLNGVDATDIDKDMYLQLCEMFNSTDTDNHVLAMEIMANCKYKPSLVYLVLLVHKYGSRVIFQQRSKNHVNFKSMMEWLNKNNLNVNHDDCIDILKAKGQLTKENMDILMNETIEELFGHYMHKNISIKEVTLKEEFLQEMNMNYVYEVTPDFIPMNEEAPVKEAHEIEEKEIQDISEEAVNEDIPEEVQEVIQAAEEVIKDTEEVLETLKPEAPELITNQVEKDESDSFEWF